MEWIRTTERLPEENRVVYTKIDDAQGLRNETRLYYYRGMWWSGGMYVYYTPTHWGI